MTRLLPLVTVALMAVAACSAPEAPEAASTPTPAPPAATPQPVAVHILVPDEPEPQVAEWAQALAEAISSGQGGLTLAAAPEKALVVVRIDAVEAGAEADPVPEGEGEVQVMRGALLVGASAHEFNLAYRGDVRPEAEALARNLRQVAVQAAAAGAAEAAPTPEEGVAAPEPEESSEEDTSGSEPGTEPGDAEDEG